MKIIFLQPNPFLGTIIPPNVISLLAVLNEAGHEVKFYDFSVFNNAWIEIFTIGVPQIIKENPDVVGITTRSEYYPLALEIAEKIKISSDKQIKIVLGGIHATATAIDTMKAFDFVDIIVKGEGEKTIVELCDILEKRRDLSKVNGIVYRNGDKVIETPPRELMTEKELDLLLNPQIEILKNPKKYTIPLLDLNIYLSQYKIRPMINLSRGCFFKCNYCIIRNMWGNTQRWRSIDNIINELLFWEEFKPTSIAFNDDNFTSNKKFVSEFCKRVRKERLDLTWGCLSRLDTINEELITKMKNANFVRINFGVESASPYVQKRIKKYPNFDNDRYYNLIKKTADHIDTVRCFFIHGFPFEKLEDLKMTYSFMKKIHEINIHMEIYQFVLYPSSCLFEQYFDRLKLGQVSIASAFVIPPLQKMYFRWIEKYPRIFSSFYEVILDEPYTQNHIDIIKKIYLLVQNSKKNELIN